MALMDASIPRFVPWIMGGVTGEQKLGLLSPQLRSILVIHVFPLLELNDLVELSYCSMELQVLVESFRSWDILYAKQFLDPVPTPGHGLQRYAGRLNAHVQSWGFAPLSQESGLCLENGLELLNMSLSDSAAPFIGPEFDEPARDVDLVLEDHEGGHWAVWSPYRASAVHGTVCETVSPFRFLDREGKDLLPERESKYSFFTSRFLKIHGQVYFAGSRCGHICCGRNHGEHRLNSPNLRCLDSLGFQSELGLVSWIPADLEVCHDEEHKVIVWNVVDSKLTQICGPTIPGLDEEILDVCGMRAFSLVLTRSGRLFAFQLGRDVFSFSSVFTQTPVRHWQADRESAHGYCDPASGVVFYPVLANGPRFKMLISCSFEYYLAKLPNGYIPFSLGRQSPQHVGLEHVDIVYFQGHILIGLTIDGEVYSVNWMLDQLQLIPNLKDIVDIRGEVGSWYALDKHGQAYSCGDAQDGALGLGREIPFDFLPRQYAPNSEQMSTPSFTDAMAQGNVELVSRPFADTAIVPFVVSPRRIPIDGTVISIAAERRSVAALVVSPL